MPLLSFTHRASFLPRLLALVGRVPEWTTRLSKCPLPAPRWRTVDRETIDDGRIERIRIAMIVPEERAGRDDTVPGYLLRPLSSSSSLSLPAALCMHQTTVPASLGSQEAVGIGGLPSQFTALELARRGYVTLAIDYPEFGDYSSVPVYGEFGYESAVGKAVVNNAHALSLLAAEPHVDTRRLCAVGHSLGGSLALLTAIVEPRLRAVVASCGLTDWRSYAEKSRWFDAGAPRLPGETPRPPSLAGWSRPKYLPLIHQHFADDADKVARELWDWPELLAAIDADGVPVFINAPTNDRIFDCDGAKQCVEHARATVSVSSIKAVHPDAAHQFPDSTRQEAWCWLDNVLANSTTTCTTR